MQISSLILGSVLTCFASDVSAACISNLEFTGDPVGAYTRENLTDIFRANPEALENFPEGIIPVNHLRFEQLGLVPDYEVPLRMKARLTPMQIEGMTMIVGPAGPVAKLIAAVGRTQGDAILPHEHYAIDYYDGAKFSAVSPVFRSEGPLELTPEEASRTVGHVAVVARSNAPEGTFEGEMVRLTHEHPVHECFVSIDPETMGFTCSPLGPEDIDFARKMSLILEDIAVAISAVTHGDIEYQAVFKDGVDVTAQSYRLLAKAERNLRRNEARSGTRRAD